MPTRSSRRFLLAQRADVDLYPPVLHQSRILERLGSVTILDTSDQTPGKSAGEQVNRHRVHSGLPANTWQKIRALFEFRSALGNQLKKNLDVAIAFEPDAAALLLGLRKTGTKRVVHFHEHVDITGYSESRVSRWAVKRMLRLIGRADLVIVADEHRADYLGDLVPVDTRIMVVMNCPLLVKQIPESSLIPFLEKRGHPTHSVVHYQGAVGPDHGLEVIIESMKFWPAESILVIVGSGSDEYTSQLEVIARNTGVVGRIVFVGRVPYEEVLSYAVGAALGVTLLDTTRSNWKFAAGASNKRFEYVALGIPQVTNPGPGIAQLFEASGVAVLADPSSPEEVGTRISSYLENPDARKTAAAKARELHLSSYNYEHQFQPVLRHLGLS